MQKKKLLLISDALSLAHVVRLLEVARHLGEYSLEFACSKQYHSLAQKYVTRVHDIFSVDPGFALNKIRKSSIIYNDEILKRYVESDIKLIEQLKPDLVIGEFRLSLSISTELTNTRYVSLLNAYWTRNYSGLKEPPSTFLPTKILGKRLAANFLSTIRNTAVRIYARPFNRMRFSLKLEPITDIYDAMASKELTCLMDVPDFMPCENLPSNFKYVGPITWDLSREASNQIQNIDFSKPTIYVTLGSTGEKKIFANILNALEQSKYQVVMTTGGQVNLQHYPKNFRVFDVLPADSVLQRAILTINHGGNGSIYQAIANNCPIIGIPTFYDQEINMERVIALGLGKKIDASRLTPPILMDVIDDVVANRKIYLANLKRLSEIQEKWNGAANTAKLVKKII